MEDVKQQPEPTVENPSPAKPLVPAAAATLLTKVAMFGVVGLVAIIAAYVFTLHVLKPMLASKPPTQQTGQPPAQAAPVAQGKEQQKPTAKPKGEAAFYTIESIVVNPAGTAGTRYLSCSVSFEIPDKGDLKVFEGKGVQIKDLLITILSSKTVEELADVKQRNEMRRQILMVVNRFIEPAKASAVYLTDFVLQ